VDDANAEATAQESEVQAALTRDLYRANAAYYREFPHHWKARKPVPDAWLELWGQTGGKPYLALHPPSPQAFAPIAQPQPQPQAQTIQAPGQTRGGSFDRAAATDSSGSGWGDYEPRPVPPIAYQPQTPSFSAPIQTQPQALSYTPTLFDWRLIQQRPDKFPHVCVVGASGDGKTATQEWIARMIGGGNHLQVLSTKRKACQWIGLKVTGLGRDFAPVSSEWHELQSELDRRCLDLDHAQTLPQRIVAIDELNDLVANSEVDLANIARAGREPRIRLVVNSHSVGVEGLGLRGKQDLKACFCWVRLGSFALQHAQALTNKGLLDSRDLAWLQTQQWPCMVDDSIATLPDLSDGWQSRLGGSIAPTPEPTSNHLEPRTQSSFEGFNTDMVRESNQPSNRPGSPLLALSAALEPNPEPPTDIESRFAEMKSLGMNKAQIIFMLWQVKKGNSSRYQMASEFYDRLNSKYQELSGDNAA
jgi:hypothetical protein